MQLGLSDAVKQQLAGEHLIGHSDDPTRDYVTAVTDWSDLFKTYNQETTVYGELGLATSETTNDSIGMVVTRTEVGERYETGLQGDTLRVVNGSEDVDDKTFKTDDSTSVYTVGEDLGSTTGHVTILGTDDGEHISTIDMNGHSGFELGEGTELTVRDTNLTNAVGEEGSLINGEEGSYVDLENVNLNGNVSEGEHGGAISSSGEVKITTDGKEREISGNSTSVDDEAIYMGESGHLVINTVNEGELTIDDKIGGAEGYRLDLTGDESGTVNLNNRIDNGDIVMDSITLNLSGYEHFKESDFEVQSGVINLINDKIEDQEAGSFHVTGDFKVNADVDLDGEIMDRLPVNTEVYNEAMIHVDKLNLTSDTQKDEVAIPFAYHQFKDNVDYIGPEELSKSTQVTTAYAPIYKYSVRYESREDMGYFVFGKGGGHSPDDSSAFNPAVLVMPVSMTAGSYTSLARGLDYGFEHLDYFTKQTNNRQSVVRASQGKECMSDYAKMQHEAVWVQPYVGFEQIGLKHGPKVNITNYGNIVGIDGELKELGSDWATVTTLYGGYNGSYMRYDGVKLRQNGGLLGGTQTFYKEKFFTAMTASVGMNQTRAKTMYGHESFDTYMAGVSSKTGYNYEFEQGKYILQPSMKVSYSYIKAHNYTNAAGVKMRGQGLRTLQLQPEVMLVVNMENNWQPYAGAGISWNVTKGTDTTANGEVLPEMKVRPYGEYKLGVQKIWLNGLSGYTQAVVRSGGRKGVEFDAGLRWAF